MPFQSCPDTAEVIVRGVRGAQQIINTFYAHKPGGYVQADIDSLAVAADGWVGTDWLPLQSSDYHYSGVTVRGLESAIDLLAENNDSEGDGGNTVSPFANNTALSVKRRSAFTGRGARGRIFTPPLSGGLIADDNHASSGGAALITAALNGFQGAVNAVDWTEVIVHRVAAGVPLAEAVVFTVVEYVVVDLVLDSMRRRLPGRGS